MIVRIIVSTVLDGGGVVTPVEGTSPVVVTAGGGCCAVAPVEGTSPARAMPESTHARTIVNAKRFISVCFSFEFEDASMLARNQPSVNTYRPLDTTSRSPATIRWFARRSSYTHQAKVYLS
jgi:hypothetical protein